MADKKEDKFADDFTRTDLASAVDESLGDDDVWNDIIEDHPVPDFVVKGFRIPQPTKEQVDEWTRLAALDDPNPERVLMSKDAYENLKGAFNTLPLSAWRSFQRRFTSHVFGLSDPGAVGK